MDKNKVRSELRKIRRQITDKDKKSATITRNFLESMFYKEADGVLLYWSTDIEVSTTELLKKSLADGKKVFLPYIDKGEMGCVTSMEDIETGHLGIGEPKKPCTAAQYGEVDVVILPGVGFDRSGNRLGQGVGWYDNFLKKLPRDVIRIGFAFSDQLLDEIPADEHDESVDFIITDKEIINTEAKSK
ncbi:MAG: 5-formyltetrahydrofolate cyclo-ligase [Candidatus Dojkabacteria bacterium]